MNARDEAERVVRMALRFDGGLMPDEARQIAEKVTHRIVARLSQSSPDWTDEAVEIAAATWAVPWLIRHRMTWGDLLPQQQAEFLRDARAALSAASAARTAKENGDEA